VKTPVDGDQLPTNIGQRAPTKQPQNDVSSDDASKWRAIPGRPGYERHTETGDVRLKTS